MIAESEVNSASITASAASAAASATVAPSSILTVNKAVHRPSFIVNIPTPGASSSFAAATPVMPPTTPVTSATYANIIGTVNDNNATENASTATPSASNTQLLVNDKFYTRDQLRDLVDAGAFIKRGKFTLAEIETLKAACQEYLLEKGFTQEVFVRSLVDRPGRKGKTSAVSADGDEESGSAVTDATAGTTTDSMRINEMVLAVCRQLPGRPYIPVKQAIRRVYHPASRYHLSINRTTGESTARPNGSCVRPPKHRWTVEEDIQLMALYEQHQGPKWELIGKAMNLYHEAVRDRFRYLAQKEACQGGKWTAEEESSLITHVLAYTEAVSSGQRHAERNFTGKEYQYPWQEIATAHGCNKSAIQCRMKWSCLKVRLQRQHYSLPAVIRYSSDLDNHLIRAIRAAGYAAEQDIYWTDLASRLENVFTVFSLRSRWLSLKKRVVNSRSMPFADLLNAIEENISQDRQQAIKDEEEEEKTY